MILVHTKFLKILNVVVTSILPFSVLKSHNGNSNCSILTAGRGSVGGYRDPLHGITLQYNRDISIGGKLMCKVTMPDILRCQSYE